MWPKIPFIESFDVKGIYFTVDTSWLFSRDESFPAEIALAAPAGIDCQGVWACTPKTAIEIMRQLYHIFLVNEHE